MRSRDVGVASLALVGFLTSALVTVPGGTWARFSDHDAVTVRAGAATWAEEIPARCGSRERYAGVVWGTMADDRLDAGTGPHIVMALGGDDTLVGGSDTDCLVGGSGDDRVVAGAGDLVVRGSGNDLVDGPVVGPVEGPVVESAPVEPVEPIEPVEPLEQSPPVVEPSDENPENPESPAPEGATPQEPVTPTE